MTVSKMSFSGSITNVGSSWPLVLGIACKRSRLLWRIDKRSLVLSGMLMGVIPVLSSSTPVIVYHATL